MMMSPSLGCPHLHVVCVHPDESLHPDLLARAGVVDVIGFPQHALVHPDVGQLSKPAGLQQTQPSQHHCPAPAALTNWALGFHRTNRKKRFLTAFTWLCNGIWQFSERILSLPTLPNKDTRCHGIWPAIFHMNPEVLLSK